MLLVCDDPQSVSCHQSLGLAQGVRVALQDREHPLPLLLSLQCHSLCCCLPLPSSPSTSSCTAAFWTRSWRNLSWIYQGQRGKALLCFCHSVHPYPQPLTASLGSRTGGEGSPASHPSRFCHWVVPAAQGAQHRTKCSLPMPEICAGEGISLFFWLPSPQICPRNFYKLERLVAAGSPWDVPPNGGQEDGAGSSWAWLCPPISLSWGYIRRSCTCVCGQIVSSLMQDRVSLSLVPVGNEPWAVSP